MYYRGNFVKQDFKEAFRLFKIAADEGVINATYYLGLMSYRGEFIEQDIKEAFRLFNIAADEGHIEAIQELDKKEFKLFLKESKEESEEPNLLIENETVVENKLNQKKQRGNMQNINIFIKENVKKISNDVYVTPQIPEKKLNNVIKAYKCENFYQSILAIYDDTLFGSAKDGLVFTGEKMIHNNGKLTEYIYSNIQSVEYIKDIKIDDKGKEKVIAEYVSIVMNDTLHKFEVTMSHSFKYDELAELLNTIITDFADFKEENQLTVISEMSEEFKKAYLKIIINMTFLNDGEIDEKELAEILLLMTRLELSKETRFELRTYITDISYENLVVLEKLIEIIKRNSESSHFQSLMISLAKDMINVHFSTSSSINRDFKFLIENQSLFNLSDEEIDLAFSAVENDYKMLKENLDNNAIKKNAEDLATKAAAAGVPLAAVYISGSVVGMSAAGITSGLATLGMGMGMTGGLVVVGLIGIMTYKGLKHLTGANELDKYKTRELMLHEVIKQTQKTISFIIDDINFIVQKLNDVTLNHSEQSEKIKKLVEMMAKFQSAIKTVDNKTNDYQNSANRLQCPKELDLSRLESLASEPTQKPLLNFIIENYEERTIKVDGKQTKSVMLKENIDTDTLDKMGEIFKALGYFDMGSIMKGKIKGIFG